MSRRLRSLSTPQTSGPSTGGKAGSKKTLLVIVTIAIIAIGVVAVVTALYLSPSLSTTTKNFAPYSSTVSQSSNNPSSVTIVNTNGAVTVSPWSQSYVMINGTTAARGVGANPDAITFIESNSSGNIIFRAVFPGGGFFFATGYTVDINVFVPQSYTFSAVGTTTVNGNIQVSTISASTVTLVDTNGKLTASAITADSLSATDTNGSVDVTCSSCHSVTATTTNGALTVDLAKLSLTGTYTLTATNGNIDLTLPATASFTITASSTNGSVSSTGLSVQLQNHIQSTIGGGAATVTATTTNGSISVAGV